MAFHSGLSESSFSSILLSSCLSSGVHLTDIRNLFVVAVDDAIDTDCPNGIQEGGGKGTVTVNLSRKTTF